MDGQISMWLVDKNMIQQNDTILDMNLLPKPQIQFNKCTNYFKDLRLIINTTLCGDWAGNQYVDENNPSLRGWDVCKEAIKSTYYKMEDAYWLINWIKIFN